MGLICEDLVWDRDQQSLSRLQSTSSAMYTMVTPYFFRHTRVNQHMAIVLFSLFNGFPKTDNNRFLHPIPEGVHLVDLHPAYRLRKFFSHMGTFSVYLREDLRLLTRDYEVELDRYKELTSGLSAFGGAPLWPLLERCNINMFPSM